MKKMLSKAMAIALSLAMLVSTGIFAPTQVSAAGESNATNVYGPDRIINIGTQHSILKDYNKAYARNKELWNAQRTDSDAIEKNKRGSNDKDIIALAKKITASSKDDYSKMRAIHDWVATNIYYDYPAYRGELDLAGDVSSPQSPFVVLDRKRAVCGGYAATTVALLRAVGIPAKSISGVVKSDNKVGHAWSQAWLSSEKRWVIMDTTWASGNKYDNGKYTKGSMRTKYFDISLSELSHSHLMTNTSEVWNKIMWYPNIKGQPNTYIAVPYMSGLTWKNPGTRPGYKFAGWFKDEGFKTAWDFNKDKAATDVNLYAKWNPETYTVRFDSNGGSAVPSVKVTYDSRLTKPKDPTREGFIFAGWTYKKNGKEFWNFIREPNISTVKGNLTLYASWQKPFTITFDSCGGTKVSSKKTGLNGLIPKPNVTPKREGYTFAGWYYKKNAKDADRPVYFGEAKVNKDTTLYARWKPGGSKSGSTTTKPTETPKPTPAQTSTPVQTSTPAPTPEAEATPVLTAAPIENGTYNIKAASNTRLSIDVVGSSMVNGSGLIFYTSTTSKNQKFNITNVGDNQYTITAVHSGKNWTSAGVKGEKITQSDVNNNSNQIFTITKYSDGTYRIQDSNGFFVGISGSEITKNSNVVLWTESTNQTQAFVLTKLKTVAAATPTPTPTPTPAPTPKPVETPEESLVPSKAEPITHATDTNKNTIKEGWYYLVCQNNYIRVNNKEAILTKEDYANQFYIRHLGGTLYSIRSMFGTYLSTESVKPRSGDKVPAKLIQEDSSSVDGWVINIDPKTNICTIHPLSNKNLVISGSGNSNVVLTDATKAKNAGKITLVPGK